MGVTSRNKEKFEDYEGFVEKFKPKKTTDDCYTPPLVYDAVADYVANHYKLNRNDFCRPFEPGGDYENFDYTDKIVVDNPPFSILVEIIRFYCDRNIPFFLFCPTLTAARYGDFCTLVLIGRSITYENGAKVNTSFATNLEPHEIRARSCPELYKMVKLADEKTIKQKTKKIPKFAYPKNVITTRDISPFSRCGVEFVLHRDESECVRILDAQKPHNKGIFGCGWLISDSARAERERAERAQAERERAERAQAEREKAIKWELSEREIDIIQTLNERGK